jgi:hypothetical protein
MDTKLTQNIPNGYKVDQMDETVPKWPYMYLTCPNFPFQGLQKLDFFGLKINNLATLHVCTIFFLHRAAKAQKNQ